MTQRAENIIFLALCAVVALTLYSVPLFSVSYVSEWQTVSVSEPVSIVFTGDIMLARGVERLMDREGAMYPFSEIGLRLNESALTIGNFEGTVPAVHQATPNYTFRFSMREETLSTLATVGFDGVSLANNHGYDYGREGYMHTKARCVDAELTCFGHPLAIAPAELFTIGEYTVAILTINTVTWTPPTEQLLRRLEEASAVSDVQIVYIHWGEEYEVQHDDAQEQLAHALIDAGADAIVGHHPHVVQDIEIYRGAPIFYSLGNFIFDQYFSDEVQIGLLVEMTLYPDRHEYDFMFVSSIGSLSRPQVMSDNEAKKYLDALITRSDGLDSYIEDLSLITPTARYAR